MQKKYTYFIGSGIIVCIVILYVEHHFPRLHIPTASPINQAHLSPTHAEPTSPISQALSSPTHVPPTSPITQTHPHKTRSPSASPIFNSMSLRTVNEIMLKCMSECVNKGGAMNPYFVHFIKTDPKWEFYEYVAVRSAVKFIKPDVVFVVTMGEMEPSCWWKRTMALPLVNHIMIPTGSDLWVKKIRDINVVERAHLCDFMKPILLYEFGGIFMDTDAIAVRSFDDLKNNQVTIAWDHNGPGYVVNGLMVSQRHSCFMCRYIQLGYQLFNGNWASSGVAPLRSMVHNELKNFKDIDILGQYTGFFPFAPHVDAWTDFALKNKKYLKVNTTGLFAVHLFHNRLTRSKNKKMTAMKGRTFDKYSWLNTSESYAGEVFRSVLPKHFTEEQFNTTNVCASLFEDLH